MKINVKKGFTLLELLIVVSLIAILATTAIILINPIKQIQKGWDSQRKNDMATTKKILEDFYSDKQCYPKASEICYDTPQQLADNSYICHICGNESSSPSLSPYINKVLCDPQHSTKPYLYHVENNTCPKSYLIYTKLSNTQDSAITEVGCQGGCGTASSPVDYTYNYCVSSSNTSCEVQVFPNCDDYSTLFTQEVGACNTCVIPCNAGVVYTRREDSICYDQCIYE